MRGAHFLIVLICLLAASACEPVDDSENTQRKPAGQSVVLKQCIARRDYPDEQRCKAMPPGRTQDECFATANGVTARNERTEPRACIRSLAWHIPKGYFYSEPLTDSNDDFVLQMGYPDLTPVPRHSFLDEVRIGFEYWPESDPAFGKFARGGGGFPREMHPTDEIVRGMRVYAYGPEAPGFAFMPVKDPNYMLGCIVNFKHIYPGGKAFLEAPTDTTYCMVRQRLPDHLYVTYWLPHRLLDRVDDVVPRMQALILGFKGETGKGDGGG